MNKPDALPAETMTLLARLELCAAWHKAGGPTPKKKGYGGVFNVCMEAKTQIEQLRLDLAQQALNGQTVMEQQKEIERLSAIEQATRVFYKRVSYRVPGLVEQIRDVDRPLRVALRLDDDVPATSREELGGWRCDHCQEWNRWGPNDGNCTRCTVTRG